LEFIEACRKFISIDSSPSHGNKVLAEFAAELCRGRGLWVELQEEIHGDLPQANIVARPSGLNQERPMLELMLQAHLDTVDPGPFGLWTDTGHNPFDAHIIDGKIYGLGAADVKLDFLCKLEAIGSFPADSKWKLPPVLVGTFGEEQGMIGALKLIRKNKVSAKMALIGEPSNLQLITAAKGFAGVEIRVPYSKEERKYKEDHNLRESTSTQSRIFHGKAAHSSMPHLGDSAIKKMLEYLMQLPDSVVVMEVDGGVNFNTVPSNAFLELDLVSGHFDSMASKISAIYREVRDLESEFLKYRDEAFNPSHPTLNIGIIRTFEDHVFISGTCRLPPVVSNDVYESWMQRLNRICQGVGAEFRVTDYKRPFQASPQSMLVRGCLDELSSIQLDTATITQASTNEASLFSRTGIECVSFGAGHRDGNIHTPKEHVAIEDLQRSIEFYKKVIQRFCL
jgi:acetylornithine deacetylase/succinyl-diaminopimelate desuccinylase-like protein